MEKIQQKDYQRGPIKEIKSFSKLETKTLITARFGMLECGKNMGGSIRSVCDTCQCPDNEEHRLNHCKKYQDINYCHDDKIEFATVYSNDIEILKNIIARISTVWNVKTGHGTMN